MYTREQISQLRQAFWTTFGQYMSPVPSAEGIKINWPNYKTGLKHIYFRMRAEKNSASIAIELTHADQGIRELYFDQFLELKTYLHETLGEDWVWEAQTTTEAGENISRIYREVSPVNVFDRNDWPTLISFFKPRLIALDEFWSNAQYSFDSLK